MKRFKNFKAFLGTQFANICQLQNIVYNLG